MLESIFDISVLMDVHLDSLDDQERASAYTYLSKTYFSRISAMIRKPSFCYIYIYKTLIVYMTRLVTYARLQARSNESGLEAKLTSSLAHACFFLLLLFYFILFSFSVRTFQVVS